MYYPIMIDLLNKQVCIIGGGKVAYKKCKSILECGARVRIISKEFVSDFLVLQTQFQNNMIMVINEYEPHFIENCYLVIAATDSIEINTLIKDECSKKKILCNVVNDIDITDYIVPSVVRRGDLIICVSTSGKSPSLCKKLKKDIENKYPEELEEYIDLLGIIREKILKDEKYMINKKSILNSLVNMNLKELKDYYKQL
ncbi:MAG: precorrin-2 dehydrogenase/sirohydrochlorin ferrochelatase family protein [Eubacteriaceae bacterium]